MRPGEAAYTVLPSQLDADAERRGLQAAAADARGHRGRRRATSLRAPSGTAARPAAREQPVSWSVRLSEHRPALTRRSVPVEQPELEGPVLSFPQQSVSRLAVPPTLARSPHGDDASMRLRPTRRALASRQAPERLPRFRDAGESRPAERQRVRASRAPNGRGCEQPDRRSADSNGCARGRPSDEGDLSPRRWERRTRQPNHVLEACSTLLLLTAIRHRSRT